MIIDIKDLTQEEAIDILNAPSYKNILWELAQWLRNTVKYEGKDEYQPIREKITELLDEAGLINDFEKA